MLERTVRDVPRNAFIQHLAKYLHNQGKLECPVQSHCRETQERAIKYKKWWFLEAAKYIVQWTEMPSKPPDIIKKPVTKEEQIYHSKIIGIMNFIKQFIELGWIVVDRTNIIVVTELGQEQLNIVANDFNRARNK